MTCDLPRYPKYRNSGMDWLQEVPEHWGVQRQGAVTRLLVSNVDKNTTDGESPVRLCNYVDVYKHERIRDDMSFMRATASEEEALRFRLVPGDVVITKDSETWDDIAVPALVESAGPDLVCGYHLAILRPNATRLLGSYLLRAGQSAPVAGQYHVAANGVTRYGLSQNAIKTVLLPIPSLSEQGAIVRYLDHADRRIQRAIRAKKRLIALLIEQKAAIIHRAVTRGLDPSVPMKPSGIEWFGEIPGHWQVLRLKGLFRERDRRTMTGTETLLSLRMYRGLVPHEEVSAVPVSPEALQGFKIVEQGQLVMNRMRAAIGMFGIAGQSGLVSPDYAVFEPSESVVGQYYLSLFKTKAAGTLFRRESKGLGTGSSGFMRLYTDRFGTIKVPVPPAREQAEIVNYIAGVTAGLDQAEQRANTQISLLQEFRTRLISDVVTGKLDVRQAAATLPDVSGYDDLTVEDDLAGEEMNEDSDDVAEELAV